MVRISQSCGGMNISTLVFFIPVMGWIAALYLSDYLDRDLDKIQKPHRPIPSGRIKPKEALFVGGIFATIGFILCFLLSIYNIVLVFVVAALVFSYTKISKSRGIMGNVNRGIVIIVAYFFGVFSAGYSLQLLPIYVWILPIAFLIHDTNSNLVGAIRDMEGDKKGGYYTIPVKYGLKKSIYISLLLTVVWLTMVITIPYYYKFLKTEFYVMMIVDIAILVSLYIYLFGSIKNYSRKRALKFHEFFVIERVVLASAFIFGIASLFTSLIVFLLVILVTITSQILLRSRYEFKETAS